MFDNEVPPLPPHGRIACNRCFDDKVDWGRSVTGTEAWRITNNPLAWGNSEPEILVLGFSKGPTQAGALERAPHNEIAFKKGRANLAKILHHVGLLERADSRLVDQAISDPGGRFHFGSLIRCTAERYDPRKREWTGTGGGMLDRFVADEFGARVVSNCSKRFLSNLPTRTKLVLMLGMGSKGSYVTACRKAFEAARPARWRSLNEVAYADGQIVVVHTEHFAAQGPLLPNWLSGRGHERGRLGLLAREAVASALK